MRYFLLALTVLLPACTRDAPELPADAPELLTSSDDTAESARLLGFATRQRSCVP